MGVVYTRQLILRRPAYNVILAGENMFYCTFYIFLFYIIWRHRCLYQMFASWLIDYSIN